MFKDIMGDDTPKDDQIGQLTMTGNEDDNSNEDETPNENVVRRRLVINRPTYTHKQFENEFGIKDCQEVNLIRNHVLKLLRPLHLKNLLGIFTILNWVSEYNITVDLIPDILSGLTG